MSDVDYTPKHLRYYCIECGKEVPRYEDTYCVDCLHSMLKEYDDE
jgi:rRNA maturation endonuclease Nob1